MGVGVPPALVSVGIRDGDCDGQSDLCHQELHCRGCCPETCIQPPAGACRVFVCAECDVHGPECVEDSVHSPECEVYGPECVEDSVHSPECEVHGPECVEDSVHGPECVADSAAIEQGARDGPTTQETCLQAPLLDDSRPGAFAVRDRSGRVASAAVLEVD